jgi:hypothetical protein
MSDERSWPSRFRVTVRTNSGHAKPCLVVTWLSQEKAVAIAVTAHVARHRPDHGPMSIHDVEVEELGPVGRTREGNMMLERGDLTDRIEF